MGEFLASGKPILTSNFNEFISKILEINQVGSVINDFKEKNLKKNISNFLNIIKSANVEMRCRKTANKYLSSKIGVISYLKVYRDIFEADKK